jgi:hypothetical protein
MAEPTAARRFLDAVRGKRGRRVLLVLLFATLGLVGWWFLGRMPAEGVVEVRWTENPPQWIALSYVDEAGETVRWRREAVRAGTDRLRDTYKLPQGTYWLRIELRRGDRLHTVRRRLELPASAPVVLYLEELAGP